MSTRVGVHEAKTHFSEYLNRAAYRGERIVVERHGKPVGALVSVADLRRLEASDGGGGEGGAAGEAARQGRFRRLLEEAGLVVQWSTGDPGPLSEYRPIAVQGPPVSEQIIAERR
jgi:prevent-host-death family protein